MHTCTGSCMIVHIVSNVINVLCHLFANEGKKKRRQYKDEEKQNLFAMILERSSLGKLNHGITKAIAEETNIPLRTIQLRWQEGKKAGGLQGVLSKRTKNCGRKRIAFNEDAIKDIDLRKRTSL